MLDNPRCSLMYFAPCVRCLLYMYSHVLLAVIYINKYSVKRRQSRDTDTNIKSLVYSQKTVFWLHYSINSHISLYLGMLVSQAQLNAYKPHKFYWRFVYIHFTQHAGHEKPRTTNVEKMRKRVPATMQCCNLWGFRVSYYISIWTTLLYYIRICPQY